MTVKRRSSEREHYTGDGCELLPPGHPLVKEHELSQIAAAHDAMEPGDLTPDERAQLAEGSRNVLNHSACPSCGGVDGCYYGCTDHD